MIEKFADISLSSLEALADVMSECTDSFLFILNSQEDSIFVSEQASAFFDFPGKKFGHAIETISRQVFRDDENVFSNEIRKITDKVKDSFNLNFRIMNKSNVPVWVNMRGSVVCTGEDNTRILLGRIAINEDVIQLDELTKLPTERQLRKDFDQFYKNEKKISGFIFKVDVDKMGEINEQFGSKTGDFVLSLISDCIKRSVKGIASAYKLNSDEFLCMNLTDGNALDAKMLYEKIKRSISDIEQKIDYEVVFTVSAGVVAFANDQSQLDELLKKVNYTVNVAKDKGRNKFLTFNAVEYAHHMRDLKLQELFRRSVREGCKGFELFYQPVVDAKNIYLDKDKTITNVIGAEGLLRFSSPECGVITPDEFIPILEKTGLIIPVSRWILKTGFSQCYEWNKVQKDFHMSLNLSYIHVKKGEVLSDVQLALGNTGVNPENITLELTESGYMDNTQELQALVNKITLLGIKVDIDDFGTGFSNLRYLQYLHAYTLKLDYSFVHKATGGDQGDSSVIKHITEMAHELNMKVCMEGVEVESDIAKLQVYSPDKFQGFYFGRPCKAAQFRENYLRSDNLFEK